MAKLKFRTIYKTKYPISKQKNFEWMETKFNNKIITIEAKSDKPTDKDIVISAYDGEKGTSLNIGQFFELLHHYNKLKEKS